ncbi:paired box protein 2 homolog [Glandiceps talaboti]
MEQGFPTPFSVRKIILDRHIQGLSFSEIASAIGVSKATVYNICHRYVTTGELATTTPPLRERTTVTDNILEHIAFYKRRQPSIYVDEIRRSLIVDNVCTIENVPSRFCSSIWTGGLGKNGLVFYKF